MTTTDDLPVEPAEPVDEVRRGRADGERADEDAERGPAPADEPGRHQLQRRRVDAGQAGAGEEAGAESRCWHRKPRAGRGWPPPPRASRRRSRGAAGADVGKVDERGEERSGDEAELDHDRQPGACGRTELPLGRAAAAGRPTPRTTSTSRAPGRRRAGPTTCVPPRSDSPALPQQARHPPVLQHAAAGLACARSRTPCAPRSPPARSGSPQRGHGSPSRRWTR